jgi:hypothetical protein
MSVHLLSLLFALTGCCFLSRKEPSFKPTDTGIQKYNNINQDRLTADVLQLFVLDAPQQCQSRNKDEIAEEHSTVPEANCQANNVSYMLQLIISNLIVLK